MLNHLKLNLLTYDNHIIYVNNYREAIDNIIDITDSIKTSVLNYKQLEDDDFNLLSEKIQLVNDDLIYYPSNTYSSGSITFGTSINNVGYSQPITSSTSNFIINSSGTVGIGTQTPSNNGWITLGNTSHVGTAIGYTQTGTNYYIDNCEFTESDGIKLNLNRYFENSKKKTIHIYYEFNLFIQNILRIKDKNTIIYYEGKSYKYSEFENFIKIDTGE